MITGIGVMINKKDPTKPPVVMAAIPNGPANRGGVKSGDTILSIEDSQDGRSHWAVRSPTGHSVEWDATVTKYVPSSVIAWESVPNSPVRASGLMRFFPLSPTATRVDLTITYQPLRTGFADAFRALVGANNTVRLRTELAQAPRELARR